MLMTFNQSIRKPCPFDRNVSFYPTIEVHSRTAELQRCFGKLDEDDKT